MRKMFIGIIILSALLIAASVRVTWTPNTETDLAGYKVYYAQPGDPGWSVNNGQATYTLGTLPHVTTMVTQSTVDISGVPGPYAIAVTALDTSGNESALSAVVSTLVPEVPTTIVVPPINLPPGAPVQVIINIVQ